MPVNQDFRSWLMQHAIQMGMFKCGQNKQVPWAGPSLDCYPSFFIYVTVFKALLEWTVS